MSKEITNPVALVVMVEFDGGVHVERARSDYGIDYSEYPDDGSRRKSCPLTFTPEEEESITQFILTVVKPQIEAHEEM